MRFRRRSKGRKEPLYWSRVCGQTFVNHLATGEELDCDLSPVEMGLVLVDAAAMAQFNSADGRITVRSLRFQKDIAANLTAGAAVPNVTMWECIVKSSLDVSAFLIGHDISTLLASEDVLSLKLYGARQLSGNANSGFNPTQAADQEPGGEHDIRVMRKLEVSDKIVALYGFLNHANATDTSGSIWSINALISVLWSRTLR